MIRCLLLLFLLPLTSISLSQTLEQEVITHGLMTSYLCKTQQYSELDSYLEGNGYEQDRKPGTKKIYRKQVETGELMILILGYEWVEVFHAHDTFKNSIDGHLSKSPFLKRETGYELMLPDSENPGYQTILTWEGENGVYLTFSPPEIHNETKSWDYHLGEIFK